MQEPKPTLISSTLSYCFRVWFLSSVLVVTFYLLGYILGLSHPFNIAGVVISSSIAMPFIFLINFFVQQIVRLTDSNTYRKILISVLHVAAVFTALMVLQWLFDKRVNLDLKSIQDIIPDIIAGWICIWKIELHPTEKYDNHQDELVL